MSFWTAIVTIVAIWGLVQLVRARRGYDKDGVRMLHEPPPPPQQDGATQRELDDLRERVKILEQITVDGREAKAIADEIERLRDK